MASKPTLKDIIKIIEENIIAIDKCMNHDKKTKRLIYGYDLRSIYDKEIGKIAIALDPTLKTIQKAIELNADMLITHHGLGLSQISGILSSSPIITVPTRAEVLKKAINHGLILYAAHTAWDFADGGNFDTLAKALGFQNYYPQPLKIGDVLLEKAVVGIELDKEYTVNDFIEYIRRMLIKIIKTYGINASNLPIMFVPGDEPIRRIALSTGGGDFVEFIDQLVALGYHAYITGELRHGAMIEAYDHGFTLIGLTHYFTETLGMKEFMKKLTDKLTESGFSVDVVFIDPGFPLKTIII